MQNFHIIHRFPEEYVASLVQEIEEHSHLWTDVGLRTGIDHDLNPFQYQSEIILRFNDPSQINAPDYDWRESKNFPPMLILNKCRQYVHTLAFHFQAERIGRAMITNLPAGAVILPHSDAGWGSPITDYYNRYHLSLKDNYGTVFRCGKEYFRPEPGTVFQFDNSLEHEVINNGESDRWTLITDLKKPTFLAEFVKVEEQEEGEQS